MEGIIQHNPELQREAEVQTKTIFLANGTIVTVACQSKPTRQMDSTPQQAVTRSCSSSGS